MHTSRCSPMGVPTPSTDTLSVLRVVITRGSGIEAAYPYGSLRG